MRKLKCWQTQDDPARAAEVWKKLLLIDPQQVDALYGLGLLELKAKRVTGASNYLAQLKQSHPGDPLTLQLEQAIPCKPVKTRTCWIRRAPRPVAASCLPSKCLKA